MNGYFEFINIRSIGPRLCGIVSHSSKSSPRECLLTGWDCYRPEVFQDAAVTFAEEIRAGFILPCFESSYLFPAL